MQYKPVPGLQFYFKQFMIVDVYVIDERVHNNHAFFPSTIMIW